MSDDTPPSPDPSAGERLYRIIHGEPPYERDTSHEPSLLPHLARLCHDFSIQEMLEAARTFGARGHPHAWPQLRSAVLATFAARFFPSDFALQGVQDPVVLAELALCRLADGGDVDVPALLQRVEHESGWAADELKARIAAATGDAAAIAAALAVPLDDYDPDTTRLLVVAARRLDVALPDAWPGAALGEVDSWIEPGRVCHLWDLLEAPQRRALVPKLFDELEYAPPWLVALVLSTIAGDLDGSLPPWLMEPGHHPPVWRTLFQRLLAAGPAASIAEATLRAHPFSDELTTIVGPHESTGGAGDDMLGHWGGSEAAAPPPMPAPGPMAPEPPVAPAPAPAPPSPGTVSPGEPAIPVVSIPPQGGQGRGGGTAANPVDDRRLGVDAFAGGRQLEHALLRGVTNEIEVSIGTAATVQLPTPAGIDFGDSERLSLPVTLYDGVTEQRATLRVRRDPASHASVTFEVTPNESHFNAKIVLYAEDGATVIEAAAFGAEVAADADAERRSTSRFQLVKVPVTAPSTDDDRTVGSLVTDGEQLVAAAPDTPIPALPGGAVSGVEPLMARFRTASSNRVATGVPVNIAPDLARAAQFGYRLRTNLRLDALGALDRIQVVSLFPAAVFPLELLYDGQPPLDDARLCEAWTAAGPGEPCPACTDPDDRSVVCPLRFWGLTRTIEHHVGTTTGNIPFAARQQFGIDVAIPAPRATVVGVSQNVLGRLSAPRATAGSDDTAADDAAVPAALSALMTSARDFGDCAYVHGWSEWCLAVGRASPGLLVAMPHQDGGPDALPSLELGGEVERVFLEGHVRPAGSHPGPIVLLLGCDTSNAPDLIASFAADLRQFAPVVVATIGRVVAPEAPRVAEVLMHHIADALARPGTTIADAILAARRTLLADGRLVGLQLIAHGDARWSLAA